MVDNWQSQPSTDPKKCPLEKQTGLQPPTARSGAKPGGALLHDIGDSLPEQAEGSCLSPDNAPARVNVASRYLGNKARRYGTMGASAAKPQHKQVLTRNGSKLLPRGRIIRWGNRAERALNAPNPAPPPSILSFTAYRLAANTRGGDSRDVEPSTVLLM